MQWRWLGLEVETTKESLKMVKNKEVHKGFEIVKVGAGEEMIKQTAGVRNREEEGMDMRTRGLPHWRFNYPLINTAGGRWLKSGWW